MGFTGLPRGPICKGAMLCAMDQRVNSWVLWNQYDPLVALIADMRGVQDAPGYLATLVRHDCMTQGIADHLRQCWYTPTDPNCLWPGKEFASITIQGRLQSFELAMLHKVPLDSYWSSLGQDPDDFKVIVIPGAQQITSILVTPPPKVEGTNPGCVPIFVTSRQGTSVTTQSL